MVVVIMMVMMAIMSLTYRGWKPLLENLAQGLKLSFFHAPWLQ